jgi:hypothetical protein
MMTLKLCPHCRQETARFDYDSDRCVRCGEEADREVGHRLHDCSPGKRGVCRCVLSAGRSPSRRWSAPMSPADARKSIPSATNLFSSSFGPSRRSTLRSRRNKIDMERAGERQEALHPTTDELASSSPATLRQERSPGALYFSPAFHRLSPFSYLLLCLLDSKHEIQSSSDPNPRKEDVCQTVLPRLPSACAVSRRESSPSKNNWTSAARHPLDHHPCRGRSRPRIPSSPDDLRGTSSSWSPFLLY